MVQFRVHPGSAVREFPILRFRPKPRIHSKTFFGADTVARAWARRRHWPATRSSIRPAPSITSLARPICGSAAASNPVVAKARAASGSTLRRAAKITIESDLHDTATDRGDLLPSEGAEAGSRLIMGHR
jgi:hypothetical protein